MSDVPHIVSTIANGVAWLRIERPERRNALGTQTMRELSDALGEAASDPEVRVIVLTGAGDRAFCAGIDLKEIDELARSGKQMPLPMTGPGRNIFEVVLETYKPTIAAINGAALGAGLELALACDLRLAVESAELGLPEAKRGMGANFGSVLLPRLLPRAIALELLFTGRSLTAQEALSLGLINRCIPGSAFEEIVREFAETIAANAPLTLQRYKHMAVKGWELPVQAALRLDVGPNPYLSEDRVEGVRAFLERRPPHFVGR